MLSNDLTALPDGLKELYLSENQIVDVSQLSLPAGLTQLELSGNQIVDVSRLSLPAGLEKLELGGTSRSYVCRPLITPVDYLGTLQITTFAASPVSPCRTA